MARWQVQRQMKKEARMATLRLQAQSMPVQEVRSVCDGDAVAAEIEENAIGAGLQRHKDLSAQLGLPFTKEMPKPSVMMSCSTTMKTRQTHGWRKGVCI